MAAFTARAIVSTLVAIGGLARAAPLAFTQEIPRPVLAAGELTGSIHIDGVLDEPAWHSAPTIENLTMSEPIQGGRPTGATRVRVLADRKVLVIGIVCEDPDARGIVSYTKARDASLVNEDHVKVVLDTFRDGRFGYVFAVNPGGARYDALVDPTGGTENANWDGVWEAGTRQDARGWSVEIRIPIATLSFRKGLDAWNFNVERRIQRLQETNRWASPSRNYRVTQTSQAGLLTELPSFDLGLGLSVRPALAAGGGIPSLDAPAGGSLEPSLDVTERLGTNLLGSFTVNTDFAETEVDTRRTNFTRFPLRFPEKRTFFLEGSDIFGFGLGLGAAGTIIPYYSRRVGLVSGQEVPIQVGGKVNGRIGGTNVGAQVVRTNEVADLVPAATMGVVRLKQNVLEESAVGMLATFGDPLGRTGSWMAGADFTYKTSDFAGDKNLFVGLWGLTMNREGLGSDRHSAGLSIEYPNDLLAFWIRGRRIGADFDPSLGFVERNGVYVTDSKWMFKPRPGRWNVRQMNYEIHWRLWTDLSGTWESFELFVVPLYWVMESGDGFEADASINSELLVEPFEVSPGVVIQPGNHHFTLYRVVGTAASKRKLGGEFQWWFGEFYDGTLDVISLSANWNPTPLVTVEFSGEHNIGRLPAGHFTQSLFGTRLRFNISSDLQVSSYVQYDTLSRSFGTNSRLRWTFKPLGDLFVIYNHNVRDFQDRWRLDSNQLIVKFQYAFRY